MTTDADLRKRAEELFFHCLPLFKRGEDQAIVSAMLQFADEQVKALLDEKKLLQAKLSSIQFAANGYCVACSGWEVTKGQGCQQNVHMKDCWLAEAIERGTEEKL